MSTRRAVSARLLEAAKRNLKLYGFGIKGFTLSMIETAVEVTGGRVPGEVDRPDPGDRPRDARASDRDAAACARDAGGARGRYRLVLITKGDLFDQERKLAQSGLGELFDAVEIVSDKDVATYARIFSRYGDGPERSMMVGNSLKSDVVPAIEAGSWGVYVPHELTWALEHVDAPEDHPRFRQVAASRRTGGDDCRDRRALKRRTAGRGRAPRGQTSRKRPPCRSQNAAADRYEPDRDRDARRRSGCCGLSRPTD